MTKKRQIKPDKLIISEEVKSSFSNNLYTVNIYNNCVSCNCPAGGKKQLCKHIISTVFNNTDKIKNEAPEFFEVLLNVFEIKNSKKVSQEQKKELYEQIMYVDAKIANKAYEHTIVLSNEPKQPKEQNIIKVDINKKLSDAKNQLLEIQSNNESDEETNIQNSMNYKKCCRCRNNIENIKDVFCPVCGSYIKLAKSHIVFITGFILFFMAILFIPNSQDKTKEALGLFIALIGMLGIFTCCVSIFMFISDLITMFKIRKKSGYKKGIFQEIRENWEYALKETEKQIQEKQQTEESNLTFTATIQTNNGIDITKKELQQISNISYKIQGKHFSGVPFCNQNCKVAVALYDGTIYIEDLERHKGIHNFEVTSIINAQLQFYDAIPYLVIQTQNSEYIFEAKEKEILKMVSSIKETLNV